MIPDGLSALALLSQFLTREVLPAVPPAMTAELRAAIKLLDTTGAELDALYPTLQAECSALLALCESARVFLNARSPPVDLTRLSALSQRVAQGFKNLSTLLACHRDVRELTTVSLLSLQQLAAEGSAEQGDLQALLQRFYAVLGQHAETRLPWQAVFPR